MTSVNLPKDPHPPNPSPGTLSLVVSNSLPNQVLLPGDAGFEQQVARFYTPDESTAIQYLQVLKAKLQNLSAREFWPVATEGIAAIAGAQYAFISKRDPVATDDPAAEPQLPSFDDPQACLVGLSIYYNGGKGNIHNSINSRYQAYGSPCAFMKHGKVLLIPENLSKVIPNNPNMLPEQPEAYLGLPLSHPKAPSADRIFGILGVMWTADGLKGRKLGYPFLQTLLHALEDSIAHKFDECGYLPIRTYANTHFDLDPIPQPLTPTSIHKPEDKSVAMSLKPYARSLSHELRTPMQGVVGMLDIMYASVQEASEGLNDGRIMSVFKTLKENIELVQDSARRAVEAADNVVHAYDMNMGVPDLPASAGEEEVVDGAQEGFFSNLTPEESRSPSRTHKRHRSSLETGPARRTKAPRRNSSHQVITGTTPLREARSLGSISYTPGTNTPHLEGTPSSHLSVERSIAPGVRHTNIAATLQSLVTDVLKVGGRPDSAVAHPIDGGEEIEVRRRISNGEEKVKHVRWSVDAAVPETIIVDEREFAGLISRVLHNAFKFTETGQITIAVRMSPKGGYILITIKDTGTGIPAAFMPYLFKAFSKEDASITRQSEGLGLGLMVAKGLARKLNGDLYTVRSETEGPNKGSEFEMRIPLAPGENVSRPGTPFGSKSPSISRSVDPERASIDRQAVANARASTPTLRQAAVNAFKPIDGLVQTATHAYDSTSSHVQASTVASANADASTELHGQSMPRMLMMTACATGVSSGLPSPRPTRNLSRKLAASLPLAFLVVEDNQLLRKVLVQMLRNLGYVRIVEAYDGAQAVRQMESHRQRFLRGEVSYEIDVVLMDLWMPTMNGYQAAEEILSRSADGTRAQERAGSGGWKRPVIMAITADVTDEAMDSVARSGMRGPLTKPYKQIDLERNLVELCGPAVGGA